ncbi:ThiJ/PfpI family protein [Colletotrichum sojae]|uniref:ThiJ/PfpI family protein n=1 Tax=Colletotrichum sojae TaxID=2175907 RepID=A0A8H6MQY8_9PEZI|nr:ThiJ/PfpI family protein [Colletotrichum sojae]
MSKKINVLVILFPGFNTLDMNGPLEVLTKSGTSDYFSVEVASETEITTSYEGVHVQRHKVLDDHLVKSAPAAYDVLVVPGGNGDKVNEQAAKLEGAFMKLVATFAISPPREFTPRVLLSICTGAFFPGNLGIFNNRYCTTHWENYQKLFTAVTEASIRTHGQPGKVIKSRFVDSGLNEAGVRIISSGGISCGLDASVYLVRLLVGEPEAIDVAEFLDYAWRQTDGVVFGEDFSDGRPSLANGAPNRSLRNRSRL